MNQPPRSGKSLSERGLGRCHCAIGIQHGNATRIWSEITSRFGLRSIEPSRLQPACGDGSSYSKWTGGESHSRHADFQSAALLTELPVRVDRVPIDVQFQTGKCFVLCTGENDTSFKGKDSLISSRVSYRIASKSPVIKPGATKVCRQPLEMSPVSRQ